jgi:hypothetical protein
MGGRALFLNNSSELCHLPFKVGRGPRFSRVCDKLPKYGTTGDAVTGRREHGYLEINTIQSAISG